MPRRSRKNKRDRKDPGEIQVTPCLPTQPQRELTAPVGILAGDNLHNQMLDFLLDFLENERLDTGIYPPESIYTLSQKGNIFP